MTLRVGMIADDLTGALDAAAPFAEQGLRTRVVMSHENWDVGDDIEVLCINTASRELSAAEAGSRVSKATQSLLAFQPEIVFKKVDSRLKGHIQVELGAMLDASSRSHIVLAPAIPDLGRFVRQGSVCGMGIAAPIVIAVLCDDLTVTTPDTIDDASLDAIAGDIARDANLVLAAGARGLAAALARRFPARPASQANFPLARPTLIAIGSRDAITRAQIDHLIHHLSPLHIEAPNGIVPAGPFAPLTLVTAEPGATEMSGASVARSFASGLAERVHQYRPASMLISGGETAHAVLTQLGVTWLDVGGEALPGIPFFKASIGGEQVVIFTKSGGFGAAETISLLAGEPAELQ